MDVLLQALVLSSTLAVVREGLESSPQSLQRVHPLRLRVQVQDAEVEVRVREVGLALQHLAVLGERSLEVAAPAVGVPEVEVRGEQIRSCTDRGLELLD